MKLDLSAPTETRLPGFGCTVRFSMTRNKNNSRESKYTPPVSQPTRPSRSWAPRKMPREVIRCHAGFVILFSLC